MKVVLFCGGMGTRLRDYSESVPKPMVTIGHRPVLWHLMKYYAHFGHREFILCLGYRGDVIKQYFLKYDECLTNDFVLSDGGKTLQLYSRDMEDWKITFADTGLNASVGERLKAIEPYLESDQVFLANYADGLSDLCLPDYLEHFRKHDRIASFLCVRPGQSFHVVSADENGLVREIRHVGQTELWVNGGFFAFKRSIFDYLGEGEDLIEEPFQRLIAEGQIVAHRFSGFWQCMDTFKEKQLLDDLYASGSTPWQVWKRPGNGLVPDNGVVGNLSSPEPGGILRPADPARRSVLR
jgi:glucose-1-phosphate cytidylyltransferase